MYNLDLMAVSDCEIDFDKDSSSSEYQPTTPSLSDESEPGVEIVEIVISDDEAIRQVRLVVAERRRKIRSEREDNIQTMKVLTCENYAFGFIIAVLNVKIDIASIYRA